MSLNRIKAVSSRALGNSLFRNTSWMLVGQGLSMACQAFYFVLLGRLLGSTEYGIYVGAAAMVSVVSQYSALGSHSVLLRYVSPNHQAFAPYWGNVLMTTVGLGSLFVVGLAWMGPHVAPAYSHFMLAMIALGDCVCAQITLASGRVFQAFEQMQLTALLNLLTNLLRASLAGLLFWQIHHASARQWVVAALVVSILGCAVALTLVTKRHGKPEYSPKLLQQRTGEGFVFALSYSTTGIYNDIDKVMLGHYGMNAANGVYTMAYRVVDVCMMPITSLHAAAFPRFFRKGVEGVKSTRGFACKILARTAPTGVLLAVMMFLAAPLIPHLVGSSFRESTAALRWLCLLPLFRSFHYSAGDALSGAGFQKLRLSTQTGAALFNTLVNLYLIPHYGWHGAAWSSLATDGMLGVLNWIVLLNVSTNTVGAGC